MKRQLLTILFLSVAYALGAQVSVQFETSDFKSAGIYDRWEQSPFRTGQLEGNVAVVNNPDRLYDEQIGKAANASAKVLAFQRSRHGSNVFGVRIDLNRPFALSPTTKYVHVLLHRPFEGRVMLIGLGKRRDRSGQSKEVEQFWEQSLSAVPLNKWADAVFAVKGAEGVEIYSLVVVADLESTHSRKSDYVAYVDDIVLDASYMPRIQYDDYPLKFPSATTLKVREDRGIVSLGINSDTLFLVEELSVGSALYSDHSGRVFNARRGSVVEPFITLRGEWMNGFCYVDYNQDGRLEPHIGADGRPADNSELVSFSHLNGIDSQGQNVGDGNNSWLPQFRLPADLPKGFYRIRFKSDWDDMDAGGNVNADNHLQRNGGGVVDATLNVHEDFVSVHEDNRNGDVLNADGTPLRSRQAFGQPFVVRLRPENGFTYSGIRIRHGYGHQGKQSVHGVVQFRDDYIGAERFDKDNCVAIPAEWVDGDLTLEGVFVQANK